MSIKKILFKEIIQRAELLKYEFKIALANPDAELIDAGRRALKNNLAKITAIHNEFINGIQTIIVKTPEEAIMTSIDLAISGEVDTVAKGLVNTAKFLSKIINSKFRVGYLTHTSILEVPGFNNLFIISDGTVTPQPNIEQKIEIIKNSIKCAKILGIERPKVALLSANELILKDISSGSDATIISKMAKNGQIADATIDGPMSLDSALSLEAVNRKKLNFSFTPPADILIAPDLESGALLIKSAVYFGKAVVAGLLWGTQRPIVLTSRADTTEAKYISMCICKLAIAGDRR
jgi:phosphate butyryltransferase